MAALISPAHGLAGLAGRISLAGFACFIATHPLHATPPDSVIARPPDSLQAAAIETGLKVMRLAYREHQWDVVYYEGERLRLQGLATPSSHLLMAQSAYASGDFGLAHVNAARACAVDTGTDGLSLTEAENARRLWFASALFQPVDVSAWTPLADTLQAQNHPCARFTSAESLAAQTLLESLRSGPELSRLKAVAWATLPGAGYAYAGDSRTAITTTVLVLGLYALGAVYVGNDAAWRGGTCLALGGIFHLSSLFGSGRAAIEANDRNTRKRIRAFQTPWFGMPP